MHNILQIDLLHFRRVLGQSSQLLLFYLISIITHSLFCTDSLLTNLLYRNVGILVRLSWFDCLNLSWTILLFLSQQRGHRLFFWIGKCHLLNFIGALLFVIRDRILDHLRKRVTASVSAVQVARHRHWLSSIPTGLLMIASNCCSLVIDKIIN